MVLNFSIRNATLKLALLLTFGPLSVSISASEFNPGIWLTARYGANGKIIPLRNPDGNNEVQFAYHLFHDDGTFTYYGTFRDGSFSIVRGSWLYDPSEKIFSLLYLEEQHHVAKQTERQVRNIHKQYDYRVKELTQHEMLLTNLRGGEAWALLRADEPILRKEVGDSLTNKEARLTGNWQYVLRQQWAPFYFNSLVKEIEFSPDRTWKMLIYEEAEWPDPDDRPSNPGPRNLLEFAGPLWFLDNHSHVLWIFASSGDARAYFLLEESGKFRLFELFFSPADDWYPLTEYRPISKND